MRWDQVSRAGAHAESSSPAPSLVWYLAEGATHGSFDLFYLLQNPSPTRRRSVQHPLPAAVRLRRSSGRYDVAPNTRVTIRVDEHARSWPPPTCRRCSTSLNAVPIIVERAMYSSAAGDVRGRPRQRRRDRPATEWFFAEGATGELLRSRSCCSPTRAPRRPTSRRPTCCRRASRAEELLGAGQQPPDASTCSSRTRRWPRPRCRSRLTSTNGVPYHRRALDVVAARAALVRGAQLRRRDDDRHQWGVGRRRSRRSCPRTPRRSC